MIERVKHWRDASGAGFTLIELLVVISIISLLSSIVLTSVNSARAKARDARRMADITALRNALALYYDDTNGSYPLLGTGEPSCWDHVDGSQLCRLAAFSIPTPNYPWLRSWSDFEQTMKPYISGGIKDPVNSETGGWYQYLVFMDPTGSKPRPAYMNMTNCTYSGNPQPGFVPVTARIVARTDLPVTTGDWYQFSKNCPYWKDHSMNDFKVFGFFIP